VLFLNCRLRATFDLTIEPSLEGWIVQSDEI